jgi:hypothetical protein
MRAILNNLLLGSGLAFSKGSQLKLGVGLKFGCSGGALAAFKPPRWSEAPADPPRRALSFVRRLSVDLSYARAGQNANYRTWKVRWSTMTKTPLYARVSTAALIGASLLPWIDIAQAQRRSFEAQHGQDGVYAVDIKARQGECASAYHLTISVSGGHVTAVGDTPIEASGQINRRGIVDLTFRRVVHVTGRLAAGSGSGTWSFPSLQCTGFWHAIRHG